MLAWLSQNVFTILIIAVLIAFFGWLLYTLIRDRKRGKSSCCGGSCSACAMCGCCHNRSAAGSNGSDKADNTPTDPAAPSNGNQ